MSARLLIGCPPLTPRNARNRTPTRGLTPSRGGPGRGGRAPSHGRRVWDLVVVVVV
jgi:hypothetical protein